MNPLTDYINKSRAGGQTDYQIRQALLQAGWSTEQVDAALPVHQGVPSQLTRPVVPTSPMPGSLPTSNDPTTPQTLRGTPKKKPKLPIIIGSLVALIILIVLITIFVGGKTGDQTIANNFITSIQNQDQAKADSLESPAFRSYETSNTGSSSFENYCISKGQGCTYFFSKSYLDKAKVINAVYTSQNGTKGDSIIYTTANSSAACRQNNGSASTLEIDLVPSKSTWLVDNINIVPGGNRSTSSCS